MGSVCPDTGNTAWLLISTLLVLSMIPGLSFFEAGLLRRKSVLSILTQMFLGYAVMGVMWFVIGFSLVFGPDHGGVVGDGTHALLRGLSNNCAFDQAEGVPSLVYALFQLMFAAITPLLITGAFAERMRLLGFLAFIVVWELLVYYPVAHLIWHPQGLLFRLGVQDFAGGLTIHTTAGVGALVSSHLLGRRHGFEKCHGEFPPHSVPLAAIGVAFLTTGWGGFNAGSAMGSGFVAAQALANTAVCCTVTALTWAVISAIQFRKRIKPVMILNSFVVGLAGITPASGYIETWACLPLGIILGVSSYFGTMLLKKTRIDDALEVTTVHGLPGLVGALAIGFFATSAVYPKSADGVFYGGGRLLWVQLVGALVTVVWTLLITVPLILVLRRGNWFTLQAHHAELGLDGKDHGESAYNDEEDSDQDEHGHGSNPATLLVNHNERHPL